MEAAGTLGKVGEQLVHLVELTAGLKNRISMIATTEAEQRSKDKDLLIWAKHIDEAITAAIRSYNQ